jgi:hypothetical protein
MTVPLTVNITTTAIGSNKPTFTESNTEALSAITDYLVTYVYPQDLRTSANPKFAGVTVNEIKTTFGSTETQIVSLPDNLGQWHFMLAVMFNNKVAVGAGGTYASPTTITVGSLTGAHKNRAEITPTAVNQFYTISALYNSDGTAIFVTNKSAYATVVDGIVINAGKSKWFVYSGAWSSCGGIDPFLLDTTGLMVGLGAIPVYLFDVQSATTSAIRIKNTGDSEAKILLGSNRDDTDEIIGEVGCYWNDNLCCWIRAYTGDNPDTKDYGYLSFGACANGYPLSEKLRIIGNGTTSFSSAIIVGDIFGAYPGDNNARVIGKIAVGEITTPVALLDTHIGSTDADGWRGHATNLAHGMTDLVPTTVWGQIRSIGTGTIVGGMLVRGISSNASQTGLELAGVMGWDDVTDSTPAVLLRGSKKNGTTDQALAAAETVFQINNCTTQLLSQLGAGTLYSAGTYRTLTSLYRRYYHMPLGSANPGASGATWVNAGANTTGGWRLTNAAHLIRGQTDVHADWDGATDLKCEVSFMVNVDNTGGADTDTVDIKATVYYKGVGDTATKSQTVENAVVVGKSAQYKQFKTTFTIDWDAASNVVEVGDKIAIVLNLETDTSEVDDIVVTDMSFYYYTAHCGIESGDV